MKNLKTAAVIAVLLMNLAAIVLSFDFYKNVAESFFSGFSYSSFLVNVQNVVITLGILFEIVLTVVFFLSASVMRDKAYRLLRFMVIMQFFFFIPYTIFYFVNYDADTTGWRFYYVIALRLVELGCVIAFLKAKPDHPVEKVDISDYELVSYTSTGHRLLHYFLDVLFMLPIWLPWYTYLDYYEGGIGFLAEIMFYAGYFLYCFLSEAIFRQTFGKILTNSCVVSNGINLSSGRVLIRTVCRYIPFDGLSFLWKGNWHDGVSSTAVVYVNSWEKVFDDKTEEGVA